MGRAGRRGVSDRREVRSGPAASMSTVGRRPGRRWSPTARTAVFAKSRGARPAGLPGCPAAGGQVQPLWPPAQHVAQKFGGRGVRPPVAGGEPSLDAADEPGPQLGEISDVADVDLRRDRSEQRSPPTGSRLRRALRGRVRRPRLHASFARLGACGWSCLGRPPTVVRTALRRTGHIARVQRGPSAQ